ncbi:leucine-rich repeat-containing protein 58-like [Lytechinus variegatus]|uniref:leucine-rich repeat-containing protein 58-like n=1 Tax=Lytechinus variegatus TaxID=7654 RepID=UPI001BB21DC5|nr:leucine-rich repeat-containing protein 58-like [Lytechinus variegatus]
MRRKPRSRRTDADMSRTESNNNQRVAMYSRKGIDVFPFDDLIEHKERLAIIDVSRNNISTIPARINNFLNIIELDLSTNRITKLPDELIQLTHLRILTCKNNHLNSDSLPKEFGTCKSLQTLNFSGNLFLNFPVQLTEIASLRVLHMGGNRIREIPPEVERLSRLQHLYLGGNHLVTLPPNVGHLPNLLSLVLCDNRLTSLPAELVQLKQLRSLSLHNNQLTILPPEIITLTELCELSLRGNPLVVRFVRDLTWNPPTLLELAARCVKNNHVHYTKEDLPGELMRFLDSARHCLNPKCNGVYFNARFQHVKFVDFCGKYRLPLMQYLCSPECSPPSGRSSSESYSSSEDPDSEEEVQVPRNTLKKVLLG